MGNIADRDGCTGCEVCMAACEKKAIEMIKDDLTGFVYPFIDESKCVDCGICREICPQMKNEGDVPSGDNPKIYAVIAKEDDIRDNSTSGGAFALFAREVLAKKGAVCGAMYDENLQVFHGIITDMNELSKMMKSKYMQSRMVMAYEDIDKKLNDGMTVLFCGTPCQCEAVKRFVHLKGKDDQLILIDLLCRGIPSPLYFHKYSRELEERFGKKITGVDFKNKSKGWHNLGIVYKFDDGEVWYESGHDSDMALSFIKYDYCVRDSCFMCKYKQRRRISDLTIGDFWRMPDTDWDDDRGTSVVFINTEKGNTLFEQIREKIRCKEFDFDTVYKGNIPALTNLENRKEERYRFFSFLQNHSFRETMVMMENKR
ncbi:MAG: Coenzyme F420 hydrogenase/dehydrogenase, beta subunit C-terminal domain [Lachnospiraceae bacterium]|nr:Coenzyme F420 hydrogenase/dehydrogenase, beta subunit C-terminal domain [Lachnospiraceae bacterium]